MNARRDSNGQVPHAAERAAALLRGGIPASRLWLVLGEESPESELGLIAQRVLAGDTPAAALAAAGGGGGAGVGVGADAGVGVGADGGSDPDSLEMAISAASLARAATSSKTKQSLMRHTWANLFAIRSFKRSARNDREAWRVLAAAWQIAEHSGVPLAPTLERFAQVFRTLERLSERRSTLLAGTGSTLRLVVALPPLALLLGWLMGFDTFRMLTEISGALAAALGLLLLTLGFVWARSLISRTERNAQPSGLALELSAISLSGALSSAHALRRVVDTVDELDATWVRLADLRSDGPIREAVNESERLGTPVTPMLLSAADALRQYADAELEREAERLAVRVLVPVGVCVLPAFILLGVVPILLAMLSGAGL